MSTLSCQWIEEVYKSIEPSIRKTPLEYSPILSHQLGVPVYLKLECLQITGSFKLRGAFFRLSILTEEEKREGIITCSAGNHGKAVAYVANKMGLRATIYVPRNVDLAKLEGMLHYGAEVIRTPFPGYDETEEFARHAAVESNRLYISPFDDPAIMAGNGGTLAKEIMAELPDARTFILPIGGGGLGGGFSYYVKEKLQNARIICCQHLDSPGLQLSLNKGFAITKLPSIETVAGGIEGGMGIQCFDYLKSRVDQVVLVSEQEIHNGFNWMLRQHQILIEPSSAAVIAAALGGKIEKLNAPTVIVLTGRNVSLETLCSLIR